MSLRASLLTYLLIASVIVALDLWSKAAVFELLETEVIPASETGGVAEMRGPAKEIPIIPSCFNLQAALNHGAFNGWFSGMRYFLVGVSLLWVLGSLFIVARNRLSTLVVIAISLTAGGAAGNLYDRYVYEAVRDFIKWFFVWNGEEKVWPNFNIADAAIVVGVGILVTLEFLRPKPVLESASAEDGAPESDSKATTAAS